MKTTHRTLALQALLATAVTWSYAANATATLITSTASDTDDTHYFDSSISGSDLVEAGSATLSSTSVVSTGSGFTGVNDGPNGSGVTSTNIYGAANSTAYLPFTSTVTFNLDISVNTLGYNITMVNSFAGNEGWSTNYGNQYYDIQYQFIDNSWTSAATVSFQPFGTTVTPGTTASWVSMTDDGGVIASGVKAIKFTVKNNGGHDGVMFKELDVFGVPVPEPGSFAMLLFGSVMLWAVRRRRIV